jgi:hypothetical protein
MDAFFVMDIQGAAIQAMETLYIIATSRNINTIIGRHDFLLLVLPRLQSAKTNEHYLEVIRSPLEQFKRMHPASEPQDYQLAVLSNPETFDVTEFYCNSLVSAIKRFCEKESEEINALKKEAAKAKRTSKIIDTIRLGKAELQNRCSSASYYPTALVEFKALSARFGEGI